MNLQSLQSASMAMRNPRGHWLLTAVLPGPSHLPDSLWLRLEDYSGELVVLDQWGVSREAGRLALPCPVYAELLAWPSPDRVRYSLIDLASLSSHQIEVAAELLPFSRTPTLAILARGALVRFHRGLANRHLRRFLSDVILDRQVFGPLLYVPASHGYHHAYPGGLLVHSTDMLEECGAFMRRRMQDDPDAAEVTQIGYLLHDLGKVVTHRGGLDGERKRLPHEVVTMQIVLPHLRKLAANDARSARRLHEIFDHCRKPACERRFNIFQGAHLVTTFDGMSVGFERDAANDGYCEAIEEIARA